LELTLFAGHWLKVGIAQDVTRPTQRSACNEISPGVEFDSIALISISEAEAFLDIAVASQQFPNGNPEWEPLMSHASRNLHNIKLPQAFSPQPSPQLEIVQ
jgi:hypothetical protein